MSAARGGCPSGSTEEPAGELAAAGAVRRVAPGAGTGSGQLAQVIAAEGRDDPSALCRAGWFDGLAGEDGEGAGATTLDAAFEQSSAMRIVIVCVRATN